MVDERPQMAASEIEQELLAELQKLPTLHDIQSVTIRPFSGPQGWTWELDRIEPEIGPEQSKFADVTNVVARLQQQFDRCCHGNLASAERKSEGLGSSSGRRRCLPILERFASEGAERVAGNKMALNVERVMDDGVNG
jgi:hypothetical protein